MVAKTPFAEYGLADTQTSLGNVLSERTHFAEAEGLLASAQQKLETLAATDPDVTDYVAGLGNVLALRGDHEQRQTHNESAVQFYGKAIDTLTALRAKSPKADRARGYLVDSFHGRAVSLTRLHRPAAALTDWESALSLAKDDEKPILQLGQAITFAQQGNHAKATSATELAIKDPKTTGKLFMQAAEVFAVAIPECSHDDQLPAVEQTRSPIGTPSAPWNC